MTHDPTEVANPSLALLRPHFLHSTDIGAYSSIQTLPSTQFVRNNLRDIRFVQFQNIEYGGGALQPSGWLAHYHACPIQWIHVRPVT